jgi:cytochrome c-type biogenesis protein CcmH
VLGACLGLILTGALAVPARAADPAVVDAVTARIICDCGCSNLTIRNCTCGKADRVRSDVAARLDSGQSPEGIVQAYVDEFGEQILAAPEPVGFNLVGWLLPFAAVFLGAVALVVAVLRWSRVAPQEAPLVAPLGAGERAGASDPSFLRRVEEELERDR